jgi:hypothetical protein
VRMTRGAIARVRARSKFDVDFPPPLVSFITSEH